jgi:hypothetical protein
MRSPAAFASAYADALCTTFPATATYPGAREGAAFDLARTIRRMVHQ